MFLKKSFLFILAVSFLSSCAGPQLNQATKGSLAGGALGAGLGAIVGNQAGNTGAGVAIGTAAGALGGALVGNSFDTQDRENQRLAGQISRNNQAISENQRLIEELRRHGADARMSKRGVVVNLPDILFEFDRDNLTPEAGRTIYEVVSVLKQNRERSLSIEGHTDSLGSVTYNKNLSLRRANSVERELARNGIPRSQMRVSGYGEGAPIATNNSAEGRARNRRVEIVIEN